MYFLPYQVCVYEHINVCVYIGGQRECFFLFSLIVPIVDYNGFANLMT